MNILFIVEHYYPYIGGAELLWKNLTESLVKKGHQVTVLTTRFNKKLPINDRINGVDIYRVNTRSRYMFTFWAVFKGLNIAKSADIIQTASYNAALPAFIISKIRRKTCVITFHELWRKLWFTLPYTPKWQLWLFYLYESIIRRLPFDQFIAVSGYTQQQLLTAGVSSDRVTKIYNGIDNYSSRQVRPQLPDAFTCCFVGRPGISKGIDILLNGLAKYNATHSSAPVQLKMIIPKHPESIFARVKKTVKALELSPFIKFFHNLSKEELELEMLKSHCVVIPSYSEGFCFVAVESVALGIPIISSGKGALKETVSGYHVEMKSHSPTGLATAIHEAVNNQYKYIPPKQYHLKNTVAAYIDLYKTRSS